VKLFGKTRAAETELEQAPPLFDEAFPQLLEHLAILARKRFAGLLQAAHRSRVLGTGFEFADHRTYVPGDDLRRIDWNVAARTERLMIRRFEEEEDLYIYIVVDVSSSMMAGGYDGVPSRLRRALRLAAALGFIGLVNLDRVGIELVDSRVQERFRPVRGRGQVLRILRFLEKAQLGGETDLYRALTETVGKAPKRGLVLLISDGYDEAGLLRGLGFLRHEGFDCAFIRLVDLRERHPKPLGDLRIEDVETGGRLELTLTPAVAKRLGQAQQELSDRLRNGARSLGIPYQERAIQESFLDCVLQTLVGGGILDGSGHSDTSLVSGAGKWR